MPELTPQQLEALKQGYPEYRKLKNITSRRGPTARMLAIINSLDSKLAVRGRIEAEFTMRGKKPTFNEDIVAQVKAAKIANQPANEKRAKDALEAFLKSTGKGSGAQGLKEELELFAAYLVAQAKPQGSVEWIPGPLKKIEKAMGKTATDYDYAWGANKDLVRGTLACDSLGSLKLTAGLVMSSCIPELGMHLIKQDEQRSVRDGGQSGTGYSGWNFVVQFRDHAAFGAEIQANTFDVLYGKMAAKEFRSQLNVSEARYAQMQARLKFPGGLGHALYDISEWGRNGTTEEEGKRATELAKDYNDACRGQFRETTLEKLNERVFAFGGTLTSAKAQELWKHGITQSGWSALARQAHGKVVVPSAVRLGVR